PAPARPRHLPGGIPEWRWYRGCCSLDADRADFFDMGDPGEALLHAVLLQGAHALVHGDGEHLGDARMLLDGLFQAVARDQQLVQAAASLEAAAAALVAADRLVERQLAPVAAVGPHPVLVDRLHRALRVRPEPGRVPQLLAVLAQEGLHHLGEVQARFPVHLYLAQALLRDLDRVLGSPDLGIRGVERLQHRVQRGGLARAGRTADEEQAVGLGHRALQLVDVARAESHFFQRNRLARGEYPHHDVLDATRSRDRRDAQLDVERPEFLE